MKYDSCTEYECTEGLYEETLSTSTVYSVEIAENNNLNIENTPTISDKVGDPITIKSTPKRKRDESAVTEVFSKIEKAVELITNKHTFYMEPDSKIIKFTTYIAKELNDLPKNVSEELMDDFILTLLSAKKKSKQNN